jgi:hypothetical protein
MRRTLAWSATMRACDSMWAMVGMVSVSSPRYCAPPTVLRRSRDRSSAARVTMSMGSRRPEMAWMAS